MTTANEELIASTGAKLNVEAMRAVRADVFPSARSRDRRLIRNVRRPVAPQCSVSDSPQHLKTCPSDQSFEKPREAASASWASSNRVSKNASLCPLKSPEWLNPVAAATAPPLAVD